MEKEIWKDIPNYNGYQVSNLGNVRTFNKTTFTKRHGIRHWKDRLLKQKIFTNQYGRKDSRVELWHNGKHKTHLVARLVAFTFNNINLDSKLTVDHLDGNSINNRLDNLEIVTIKENIKRAFQNNLNSTCIKIKLINKTTLEQKNFYSMNEAGKYMGFKHGYISDKIKRGKFSNKNYCWEIIK